MRLAPPVFACRKCENLAQMQKTALTVIRQRCPYTRVTPFRQARFHLAIAADCPPFIELLKRLSMSQSTLSRLGWTLSALYGLFMLWASVAPKLMGLAVACETMAGLGWP